MGISTKQPMSDILCHSKNAGYLVSFFFYVYPQAYGVFFHIYYLMTSTCMAIPIGSILNPLAGKISEDKRKKGSLKARKQGQLTIGGAFICRNMIG